MIDSSQGSGSIKSVMLHATAGIVSTYADVYMYRYVGIRWPARETERQLSGCCMLFFQAGTGQSITPALQVWPDLAGSCQVVASQKHSDPEDVCVSLLQMSHELRSE